MTETSKHKEDHAQDAVLGYLHRAALVHQAEIVCLTAIPSSEWNCIFLGSSLSDILDSRSSSSTPSPNSDLLRFAVTLFRDDPLKRSRTDYDNVEFNETKSANELKGKIPAPNLLCRASSQQAQSQKELMQVFFLENIQCHPAGT